MKNKQHEFTCGYMELLSNYNIISFDEKKMAAGSSMLKETICTDSLVCEEHTGMELKVYCPEHDTVMCSSCLSLYHSQCSGFQPLSDLLLKNSQKKESKNFHKEIDEFRKQLLKIKNKRQEEKRKLTEDTEGAIKDLEDFRSLINWVLDRIEHKGREYIQKRYRELNTIIVNEIAKCDEMLQLLEKMKSQPKPDTKQLSLEGFIRLKKGKQVFKKVEKLCSGMNNHKSRGIVKFTVDSKVESFARSLSWYGKDRTYLGFEQPISFPHMYQIKNDNQFDIRVKGDKHVCSVMDICQLTDGTLLLVDAANRQVKHMDVLYQLLDSCSLPGEPSAVCCISANTAAVALKCESECIIQFLELNSFLELGHSFPISRQCYGLTCDQKKLYVSNGECIQMYLLSGEFFGELHTGLPVGHLALTTDFDKLVVICHDGKLVIMNTCGEVLKDVLNHNLNSASKVTVDQNGQIFVTLVDSHSVVQYNHDLQELGVILAPSHGIKYPQAITFDKIHNRLVTAMKFKNVIKLFELI